MSYAKPATGCAMNGWLSCLCDFEALLWHLEQAESREAFDAWLDKLVLIDRRSAILWLGRNMPGLPDDRKASARLRIGRRSAAMLDEGLVPDPSVLPPIPDPSVPDGFMESRAAFSMDKAAEEWNAAGAGPMHLLAMRGSAMAFASDGPAGCRGDTEIRRKAMGIAESAGKAEGLPDGWLSSYAARTGIAPERLVPHAGPPAYSEAFRIGDVLVSALDDRYALRLLAACLDSALADPRPIPGVMDPLPGMLSMSGIPPDRAGEALSGLLLEPDAVSAAAMACLVRGPDAVSAAIEASARKIRAAREAAMKARLPGKEWTL